jgi:2'-5' RNA ligase
MGRDRASRPEARPLRLFVAVDIPVDVRELVEREVAPIRERHPRARWVPTQNQHVTLKFLGSTWPRLVEAVTRTVGDVASDHASFETHVAELGAFPSARRARVLWVALDDPERRLARIGAALDDALAKEFPPEKRAFTPHLTVARFDPQVPLGEEIEGVELRSRPFLIEELILFRSHLRRPAPVYEPLERFALGGAPGGGRGSGGR